MARSQLDTDNPSEFEDSLARGGSMGGDLDVADQQDQERYQELAEQENRARRSSFLKDEITRQVGKRVGKQALAAGARVGATAVGSAAAGTTTFFSWPVILGIIAVIVGLILFFIMIIATLYSFCNQEGTDGFLARFGSKIMGGINVLNGGEYFDICKQFTGLAGEGAANPSQAITPNGQSVPIQPPSDDGSPANNMGDAAARQRLASAYISVNKNCVDETRVVGGAGQTCLGRTKSFVIDEIIRLKQACDAWAAANKRSPEGASYANAPAENSFCYVYVTGGSEPGHAVGSCSHGAGYKIDLSVQRNNNLLEFIKYQATSTGTRAGDPLYNYDPTKSEYVLELSAKDDHWDITVGCG